MTFTTFNPFPKNVSGHSELVASFLTGEQAPHPTGLPKLLGGINQGSANMFRCSRSVAFLHCIDRVFRGSTDVGDQVDLEKVSEVPMPRMGAPTFNLSRGAVQVREIAPAIPPARKYPGEQLR